MAETAVLPLIHPLATAPGHRPPVERARRGRPVHRTHQPPHHPPPASRSAPPRQPRQPRALCGPTGGGPTGGGPAGGGPAGLADRFARRLVEVLCGVRPAGQLVRHTTHDGYRQLARLASRGPLRTAAGTPHPLLGPVHDFSPGPGALEVCVRVAAGPRHHMVAFRLERHRRTEQWQCAAVEAR
ncbi:Rv3235 family protein [Kitasatospora sp. NPDC052896]|uniref:Rv3235 family protein n=1 Tax=Kitasatospora sp. NPDC052896 TaxID=3364061 RepID=UPI0037C84DA0